MNNAYLFIWHSSDGSVRSLVVHTAQPEQVATAYRSCCNHVTYVRVGA